MTTPPPGRGHLTPTGVAALARVARPRELLLTHVYPGVDRASLPAKVREAGWEGAVAVARDGTVRVVG